MDGQYYVLENIPQIELACMLAADYHNNTFYNGCQDDGWNENTRLLELQAEEAMLEKTSDEDSEPVVDMEYVSLDDEIYETKPGRVHDKKKLDCV